MKYVELDSAEQLTFNTGVSVTKFGSVLTHSFVTSSLLKATMHFVKMYKQCRVNWITDIHGAKTTKTFRQKKRNKRKNH